MKNYKPTIGIECHVQLATQSKLFSGADNDATQKAPNQTVSLVDYGLPGVLPILNREAVFLAVRAGLAMNCKIATTSRFERKHYFYPDSPKGYQITQLAEPIILEGKVEYLLDEKTYSVRIHHAHLEEDAGKLVHPKGENYSLVDLNRVGTPLIEIVTEPDMHSAKEARAFAEELYRIMTYADVTHGNLFHGNMRFDVNVSVAPEGQTLLGNRTETKNLNSFRSIQRAVEYEITRQTKILESGEIVKQETRGWDETSGTTFSQRSKEDAQDYRYMPEPDVPPIVISGKSIEECKKILPKLPSEYKIEWNNFGWNNQLISKTLQNKWVSRLVSDIALENKNAAKTVAKWFANAETIPKRPFDKKEFVELYYLLESGSLHTTGAKTVFQVLVENSQAEAKEVATSLSLLQETSDNNEIQEIVVSVITDPNNSSIMESIRSGNEKAIGALIGAVMKQSKGKADPKIVKKIISEIL